LFESWSRERTPKTEGHCFRVAGADQYRKRCTFRLLAEQVTAMVRRATVFSFRLFVFYIFEV
jgi:hypothetical protein